MFRPDAGQTEYVIRQAISGSLARYARSLGSLFVLEPLPWNRNCTKQPVDIMDKLQPIFDLIEGCDPKVSALAGVGALIVAKFALNVSGTFSRGSGGIGM